MESPVLRETVVRNDSHGSGLSWGAVIAGAFVAAALSLSLLALGTGIGLSAVSPWANPGATASKIGWTAIIWLVLMQLIASSMGGYLAGRLRTRWISIHTHEVYFRDTAHGFLVWAVGLVITAAFLTSAASSMLGGAVRATVSDPSTQSQTRRTNEYFVDTLLRSANPSTGQDDAPIKGEVGIIFANDIWEGNMPDADKSYLAHVVAARSGVNQSDAEKRVDEVFGRAKQSVDFARKEVAHGMYWTFLALLVGAFCASLAATIGGKQRDSVVVV